MLCGLAPIESGAILWNDVPIQKQRADFQRDLCYLGHLNGLQESMTVRENLMMVPAGQSGETLLNTWLRRGRIREEERALRKKADEVLEFLTISHVADEKAGNLSGGQKQRVAVARALVTRAELVLADEPTGALDSRSGEEVMAILHQLKAQGHTVIIVTHDPQVAAQAERIIEIHDGEIVRNPPAKSLTGGGVARPLGGEEPSAWRQFTSGFREALVMAWRAMARTMVSLRSTCLISTLATLMPQASVCGCSRPLTSRHQWWTCCPAPELGVRHRVWTAARSGLA